MQTVILTELGIVVYDGDKFLKSFPFKEPAGDYLAVKNGEARISELVKHLSSLDTGVIVNDVALHDILKKKSIDGQLMTEDENEKIQSTKPQILVDSGLAKDQKEVMTKLRDFALQLSSSKVTEVSQSPDLHIIQAINSLDDVDKIGNAMSSRLREWYGLHFPELDNMIDSIVGYSQIVTAGKRENLSDKVFEDAGFPESKVEMLSLVREKSRGGDITDANLEIVQTLAKQILDLHKLRKTVEDHVESQMKTMAPNVSAILGTAVGARILARAGSLKKLATMPASTIQVLGAEKALFRSLKTGSQPPKHGLLFQHPLVHAAPRWQRGKIARAIAAKAAIAARVDVYGGGLNKTLLEKLNVRVDEIDKKYKEPPPPKPKQESSFRRDDDRRGRGRRNDRGSGFRKPRGDRDSRGSRNDRDSGSRKPRRFDRDSDSRSQRKDRDSKSKKMKGKKRKKFGRR